MLVHFHHAAALHVHSPGARTGCGRADCKDRIFDITEDQTFVPTKELREVEIERALRLLRQGTVGLL